MMFVVHCVLFVLYKSALCDDTTEVHGDITGPGPHGNMFEEVFNYAYKNYYKNHPKYPNGPPKDSRERRKKACVKEEPYDHPTVPPHPPQYFFPQHFYMPQAPPYHHIPPYNPYYPPYYAPHPPPPYHYPYRPETEKSPDTTTQNLWELYQQLKLKFETTNADAVTLPADNYHRHYNRRVQMNNAYVPRQRYNQQNYQPQQYYNNQHQQQQYYQPHQQYYQQSYPQNQQNRNQPEFEKVANVPEEPFARYTTPQSQQRNERPAQNTKELKDETRIPEDKMKETEQTEFLTTPDTPVPMTVAKVFGGEKIFEPRNEDTEALRQAKVKHWEKIMSNIKSSLGITDDSFQDVTLPEEVLRDKAEIEADWFTPPTIHPEQKKYGITLVDNDEHGSYSDAHIGFDWSKEEKAAARRKTREMMELYRQHKDKFEFPEDFSEKQRLEQAEYRNKKKMLYKSPCSQEFRDRHDKMGKIVHRALAIAYRLRTIDPSIKDDEYEPAPVEENGRYKMIWDQEIRLSRDRHIFYNRPDMIIWNKKRNSLQIIDFAVVNYDKVVETRMRKMKKYSELAREIMNQWKISDVKIIPIIVTTSGRLPSCLKPNLSLLNICKDDVMKRLMESVMMSSYIMYQNKEQHSFDSHERPEV